MLDYFNIDWNLFHFIRPQWLWFFIPMLIISALTLINVTPKQKWPQFIDKHLRPFIIQKGNRFAKIGPILIFILFSSAIIISIAGPTWKKTELPGAKNEAVLLIGLDLSQSMMCEDISPNRLERAKFYIKDLLEANPGSKVGLLAFAGTAHHVITPCDDYHLIEYQLESLLPGVMPVPGTNYNHLLTLADSTLNRSQAPGTLMLITDVIDASQKTLLTTFTQNSKHSIELLCLSTPQGAPIPSYGKGQYFVKNGKQVISKLDQNILFELQNNPKINVNTFSFDKDNVTQIAEKVRENLIYRNPEGETSEDWEEMGFMLLWLVLVIMVLWFRKGWMIQYAIILFAFNSCTTKVESWEDLWYSKDYQAQQAMDKQSYESAAQTFESLSHKAVAFYKAGDYESAIALFKLDSSSTSMYNLGLAYAASGQYELAAEALQKAQASDPDNDLIQQSIQQNEQMKMQVDSMRSLNPGEAQELQQKEEKKEDLEEFKATTKDEELSSDTEAKELPKDGKRVTDEVETDIRKANELEKVPEDFKSQEAEAAQNIMLREISADPSEFLKRRFKFQYEKYYSQEKEEMDPW
jgi:Ca-activated chloride channel family protein